MYLDGFHLKMHTIDYPTQAELSEFECGSCKYACMLHVCMLTVSISLSRSFYILSLKVWSTMYIRTYICTYVHA